jgi:hypothetical protein
MKDIAGRLVAVFAQNVEARLSMPDAVAHPAAELSATSLFFSVVASRIRARLRRLFG